MTAEIELGAAVAVVVAAMVLVVDVEVVGPETVRRAAAVEPTKARVAGAAADAVGTRVRDAAVEPIKARVAGAAADAAGTRVRDAAVEAVVAEDEEIAAGVALSVPAAVEVHPPRKGTIYPQRKLPMRL